MKKLIKRDVPKHEGNGTSNYLKISDGKSATGVFRGEIFEFWQSWPKGGTKQIFDEPTAGASSRFRFNFVTREDGKAIAKVWEFGLTVYNMLAEISENFDLETTQIKITRRGTDKNTQWMIIPLGAIPAAGLKEVSAVPLNILNGRDNTPPLPDESERIPF